MSTLNVVAWDNNAQRLVRTAADPANIVGGIVLDQVVASSVALTAGTTSATIGFTYSFSSIGSFALVVNLTNQIDTSPQFQPVIVTSITTTGFTAIWNMPLDSSNYYIDYIAVSPVLSFVANVETIPITTNSHTSLLLSAPSYATIPQMTNLTDTTPLILHPINITSKNSSGFTSMWNMNTDTANYGLHWMATFTSSSVLKAGSTPISNVATSVTVPYIFPALASSNYAVVPRLTNITDSSTLYQPITVTSKTLTSFTAKWNQPVDSVNYTMDWILKTM